LCLVFNSLSKRSNLPGLRSGFVAGDPELIEAFRLYRTYHGSAMALHTQSISTLAWQDEGHVIENRALYRKKFETFLSTVETVWPMQRPPASFFLFPEIPVIRGLKRQDDEAFTRWLFKHAGIRVLPGSYLSRDAEGVNPGAGHVRIALVEAEAQVEIAARRIVQAIAEFS
jgi:N-succinyldiaminopimelate aminotransferase